MRKIPAAMATAMAAMAAILFAMSSANAHSFNVALLVGQAATAADQIRDGFLLAIKERDSHPDQESDGHLGGLDVYLFVVDGRDTPLAAIRAALERRTIDILGVVGSTVSIEAVRTLTARTRTVLLTPGRTPFPSSTPTTAAARTPAIRAFVKAFEAEYSYIPSPAAAQGYNAARRIDAAVRAQGGVSDRRALQRALAESAGGIDWSR